MTMKWDQDAIEAVAKAPALLRGMVKRRVESQVASTGGDRVTLADVQEARTRAGRGGGDAGGLSAVEIERIVAETKNSVVSDSRFFEVTVCGGAFGCPRALFDVKALAGMIVARIESSGLPEVVAVRTSGPILRHHKFNVAISGCPNSCSQPQIQDFGVQGRARVVVTSSPCVGCMACVHTCREGAIAVDGNRVEIDRDRCIDCGDCAAVCPTGSLERGEVGYSVLIGGKLGRHPLLALEVAPFASEDELTAWLDRAIGIFVRMAPGERLADAVRRGQNER